MKINISFKEFKKNHSKKKHQILFRTRTCKEYYKVENKLKDMQRGVTTGFAKGGLASRRK